LQNYNIRLKISYVWQDSDNGMLQVQLLYFWTSSIITTEELQGLRFSQWRCGGDGDDEESGVPGYDTMSIGE